MHDERLAQIKFLTILEEHENGQLLLSFFEDKIVRLGLSSRKFKEMVVLLMDKGYVNAPDVDRNFAPEEFVRQIRSIQINHPGSIYLSELRELTKVQRTPMKATTSSSQAKKRTDREFMILSIEQAKKSRVEDKQPHPFVGAVVVKNGRVLAKGFRG